jgi:segregation and condensation protein B
VNDEGVEAPREVQPVDEARRAIEAVVLASTEPVEARFLAELVELPAARVEQICAQLAAEYEAEQRGFALTRVAGGYRFQTHPDLAPYVERFVVEGRHVRLSGPALETLAIIAYKQPVSRGQISAIRGVNVEATLQTLVARGYVEEVARDPGPGLAVLYGTTSTFLERLGLDSIDDLPALGDFVPDASVVEALERGLRMPDDAGAALVRDEDDGTFEAG